MQLTLHKILLCNLGCLRILCRLFSLFLTLGQQGRDVKRFRTGTTGNVEGADSRGRRNHVRHLSTVMRAFDLPDNPGDRLGATISRIVHSTELHSKVDVRKQRSAKDVGWHHPEWWEHHNYERR